VSRTNSNASSTFFVQSLAKGLSVLKAFGHDNPQLTLSDVAREVGLSRAAARRYLLTFEALGYVASDGRLFTLRPRVLELGYAYLSSIRLPSLALPHLEALVAHTKESSSISVLDGAEIVYIARVPTKRIMTVNIDVGTRFPAAATSMGRVLLAALEPDDRRQRIGRLVRYTDRTVVQVSRLETVLKRISEQGWAAVDQELEEGLRSVAVPIRDNKGQVVAAANISAHASRASMKDLQERFLPRLQSAVAHIEADLLQLPLQDTTRITGL